MRSLLTAIVVALLALTDSQREVVAAEIYTFGRSSDGSRYVKHVDRPMAERKARENPDQSASGQNGGGQDNSRKQQGSSGTRGTPPPPPLDPKALEVLNSPVM